MPRAEIRLVGKPEQKREAILVAPFDLLPADSVARFRCYDCNTETAHSVGRIVLEGYGHYCGLEIADMLECDRPGCHGPLLVALDLPE